MTDALLGEHAVFYAIFDHVEQAVLSVRAAREVNSIAALLSSVLVPHAKLENDYLFASLDPYLGSPGPLAVMRQEHEEIERALAELSKIQDLGRLKSRLLHVLRSVRDHFKKEELVLFPMAEQRLGADVLDELGARWADARRVTIG